MKTTTTLPALVAATVLATATAVQAEPDQRVEQVQFPAGRTQTNLQGRIVGYESVSYRLGAEAGQRLNIRLSPSNTATYFNVYAPGSGPGDQALGNSSMTGNLVPELNHFDAELPTSGEYGISVYMMRSAARRDEVSDYRLAISLTGAPEPIVRADYADGLQGGPDYFEVATQGDGLSLRASPSIGAAMLTRLANGTQVRNLGCRMAEGRRWCHVTTLADPGEGGWVAGAFLIEGRGPSAATESAGGAAGEHGATQNQRVRFDRGTSGTELTGQLAPGASRRYQIDARDGQMLYVRVASQDAPLEYQIFNPDASFLLDQITSEQEYRGQLWQSGDHVIEVINRNQTPASYHLIIGIE